MTRFRIKPRLSAIVLSVGVFSCGASTTSPNPATPGSPSDPTAASATSSAGMAPDFSIDLTDAETFHLSDHLGKDVIVIDFWSTYCTPCVAVMHHLEGLHKRLKNKGLVILAVAMDPPESAGQIVPFIRSHDFTFRVAHDINSEITQLYNKKSSAPYQVLIGRDGKIRKV
ncbi:MAG: TlpA family protein disulfide reductase, partial [Polyangiaceae bacterium]|nr:TlpA family protein disulfide reductase [Polyangiaceae bacterium]